MATERDMLDMMAGGETNRSIDLLRDFTKPKQSNLTNLSDDDIANIWSYISEYISKQLQQHKGVHINGLGTFTFTKKMTAQKNNKKAKEINRPVFILSEKFVLQHALPSQKQYNTGEVPVIPLNFAAIAFESPYHRDVIESCTKEVLTWLSRSVNSNNNVEFVFSQLGRLTIKEKKVKMRFFKEFINSLTNSSEVMTSMVNRPFTPDSVMSDRPITSRPGTTTLLLPSVAICKPKKDCKVLPAIVENDSENTPRSNNREEHNNEENSKHVDKQVAHSTLELNAPQNECGLGAAAAANDVEKQLSSRAAHSQQSNTRPPVAALKRSYTSPNLVTNRSNSSSQLPSNRPESHASQQGSDCGHKTTRGGQDLCYMCHQRDLRNVPVDFTAERQRRIEEEDKLLAQYQNLRDTEAILKEQEKLMDGRNLQKNISAFNLGVADAVKYEKSKKEKYQPSFLLQTRPYTPNKCFQQATYYEDLNHQVVSKNEREKKMKEDKAFLEKLEQIQLAEDLAAQREAYVRERESQKEALKRALDTQVKYKPEEIPKAEPDSDKPVFGLHDASSNEKLEERARREKELKQELLEAAKEKKKEAILTELLNQKEEEEMLQDVRKELCADHINRHNRLFNQRKDLESDWLRSMYIKQQREEDENRHRLHGGALLLDQAHVSRCAQCQRKLHNKGKTNLWKESYYVPGARLIL